MTATPRALWRAVAVEPVALAISQPHQALISSASVYLVAAEAGTLIAAPFNVLLAVGAEWAYLKGLSSASRVTSPWAARLNWAAVLLVILYGSLWGFRKFGVLPPAGEPVGDMALGVVLTLIHILSIGAVTLCSAMVHRDEASVGAAREERLQAERDRIAIEVERKRAELAAWEEGQRAVARLKAEERDRKSARLAVRTARTASRSGASASVLACPHCGTSVPDAGAKGRAVRYGYCAACKEVTDGRAE